MNTTHDPHMAADLFGGAAEIHGLCARIAKAQAEVDDLTQALQEHPDARGMDLSEFLVSATGAEIRRACAKLGIRSDIFFAAMMSKTPKPTKPETEHQRRARESMERIAKLPKLEQHRAMARASRSYSAPESCIRDYGCVIDGTSMRWPDGELYPLRQDGELPGGITFIEPPGNI